MPLHVAGRPRTLLHFCQSPRLCRHDTNGTHSPRRLRTKRVPRRMGSRRA